MTEAGKITISLQEHCTAYPRLRSIPEIVWLIAAKKVCPVAKGLDAAPHPDFKYRVILDHTETVTIEWRKL